MAFCKEYKARTAAQTGTVIPVEITVFQDRSFTFVTKTPPAADLLRKAANVEKGSGEPNRHKVGRVTQADVRQIAETKAKDLSAFDVDAAMKIVAGTARSMGIEIAES